MRKNYQVLALTSGGFDSFFMLWHLKQDNTTPSNIHPLYVKYEHLAAKQELLLLKKQCDYLDLKPPKEISITNVSAHLTNNLTVQGQQESDFYPGRNLMILVNAAQIAYGLGINYIAIGTIQSHREFSDSNTLGLQEIEKTINLTIFGPIIFANNQYSPRIRILVPVAKFTKRELRVLYHENNLPHDMVYSCQKGNPKPCGECPPCKELDDANEWFNCSSY